MDNIEKIIDDINNLDIIKELSNIKNKISDDKKLKDMIDNFKKNKDLFEKEGRLLEEKTKLMKEPIIKRYLQIQNEINLLSLKINKNIDEIIENKRCN